MIEKIDRIVYSIIHMPNCSEGQKKDVLVKLLHTFSSKTGNTLEQSNVNSVFDTCVSIITAEENVAAAHLAVFTFGKWAEQYKSYLKEYLTPERVSTNLGVQINHVLLIEWLKDVLYLLQDDTDTMCTLAPIIENTLQNKLRDCGGNPLFVAKLSDLYAVCPTVLPQPHTRLTFTITLMKCVASFPTPTKPEVLGHMKSIGALINTLWNGMRLEDILSSLNAMYAIISNTDGGSEVCPAMAHVLSLVPTVVVEKLAPRIVADKATTDAALIATLDRLTEWLVRWPIAHQTLGFWVRTLVRLLYQNGRKSVPSRVTINCVTMLLPHMHIPIVRFGVVSVISTLLLSLQHSPLAFHKVIPQLMDVFVKLERENSENARVTLKQLATLVHTLMALHSGYPQAYQPIMDLLEKYPAPSDQDIQGLIREHAWAPNDGSRSGMSQMGMVIEAPLVYQQRTPNQKVGLRNLGNTCYMNSVIQALFMTDSFRHQILHAVPRSNQQLLGKLQQLFSLLCFTNRTYVAPRMFHDKSRPPWFSPGMQQDCSEYLRHLMITLHEEERACQKLPEYQERLIIESETASLASDLQPLPYDCPSDDFAESDNYLFAKVLAPQQEPGYSRQDASNVETDMEVESAEMRHSAPKIKSVNSQDSMAECLGEEPMEIGNDEVVYGEAKCSGEEYSLVPDASEKNESKNTDYFSKSSHIKRKHSLNRDGLPDPMIKSSKGDIITSDIDNSSDSGISGDLAEDIELRSPIANSPCPKESYLPNRDLTVEEVVIEDSNIEDTDNEYFVSLVHKVFGGKSATRIKCLQCKTESIHKDVFTDIHLAFQDTDRYNATAAIRRNPDRYCKQKQENPVDLRIEDMITNYLTSEMLTGENQYACDRCGGKQDAERSIQILEPPEHLILTQLRFYYDMAKGQRQKVFTNVEFGEELLLPVRYSTQGILDHRISLGDDKGALQGYLSGNETPRIDDRTSDSQVSRVGCTSPMESISSVQCGENYTVSNELKSQNSLDFKTEYGSVDESANSPKPCCSKSTDNTPQFNGKTLNKKSSIKTGSGSSDFESVVSQRLVDNPARTVPPISDKNNSVSASAHGFDPSLNPQPGCSKHEDPNFVPQPSCSKQENPNFIPQPRCIKQENPNFIPQPSCSKQDDPNIDPQPSCSKQEDPNLDAQPSCSRASMMTDSVLVSNSENFTNNSEASSCCMTPQGDGNGEEITYARYALYGVVVHSGFSSEGGHYYCYGRNSSVASLSESARESYGNPGQWYNFNDERVTNTSFSAINNLTRTFSRDTAYQLFYKKFSDRLTPDVPLVEDFKSLRLDLRETVECDNMQYQSEQDRDSQRRRCHVSGGSQYPHDSDHDGTPPPGGCGGGPGGGGFNTPSRVVF